MLTIRESLPGGVLRLRTVTRASLPDGPAPAEGRRLTDQQLNDAIKLAAHAMSRSPGVGRADYDLGFEALEHILGHIIVISNEHGESVATLANDHGIGPPPSEGWGWVLTDEHEGPRWVKWPYAVEPMLDLDDMHTWTLWENGVGHGYPTARAAMRAADEKAAGESRG